MGAMLAVARGDPGPEPPGARGSVRLVPGVRGPTVAVLARLAGGVGLETSLPRLISGVAAAAPGGFAVVWSGAGMDATTVGIGGGSFRGTQATAPTLVL